MTGETLFIDARGLAFHFHFHYAEFPGLPGGIPGMGVEKGKFNLSNFF